MRGGVDPYAPVVHPQSATRTLAPVYKEFVLRGIILSVLGLLVLASCASAGDSSSTPASAASSDAVASQPSAASPTTAASAGASAQASQQVTADDLVRAVVEGLSVRTDPSTVADRLGTLPADATAFVLAGPVDADGHAWYQLANLGNPSADECAAETRPFHCAPWVGWAAGAAPEGDPWLEPIDTDCPAERDTPAYISTDALTRLACAGDAEWKLVAYVAPMAAGRGCFPVWIVDPFWMDSACTLNFPQPAESETDMDTSIQAFVPPELGECLPAACPPFDELKGSWVEIVGHLDDPAAETCTSVLNESISPAPHPPPDRDLTVFTCRLNLVVTQVTSTTPPASH